MDIQDFHEDMRLRIQEGLEKMPIIPVRDAIRSTEVLLMEGGHVIRGLIGPFDIAPPVSTEITPKEKEVIESYARKHDCTLNVLEGQVKQILKGWDFTLEKRINYYQNGYIAVSFSLAIIGKSIKGMDGDFFIITSGGSRFDNQFVAINKTTNEVVSKFYDFNRAREIIEMSSISNKNTVLN